MKRAVFIFALAMGILFHGTSYAGEGFYEKMLICSQMEDGAKRLECYDNTINKNNNKNTDKNNWKINITEFKIDDSKSILIRTEDTQNMNLMNVVPRFIIRIIKNEIDVFISWDFHLKNKDYPLRIRIDKNKPEIIPSRTSYEGKDSFLYDPLNFIERLLNHETLLVEIVSDDGIPVLAEFNISGLKDILEKIEL